MANGHNPDFCHATCRDVKLNTVVTGDSRDLLKCLPSDSVDLVVTSPPYAMKRKKHGHGGVPADDYVDWFMPFTKEIHRVLKPTGSFILNINDVLVKQRRHPYVYRLVLEILDNDWEWIDTYIWHKKNPYPGKRKYRFKDGFEYIYHFVKSDPIKFFPDEVRQPPAENTIKRLKQTRKNDENRRWSGTGSGFNTNMIKMQTYKTVLPSNVLHLPTEVRNKGHSAAFPERLPEFFIKAFSEKGDTVLDPFAGSGTTLKVAKKECRNWIGFDQSPEHADVATDRVTNAEGGTC